MPMAIYLMKALILTASKPKQSMMKSNVLPVGSSLGAARGCGVEEAGAYWPGTWLLILPGCRTTRSEARRSHMLPGNIVIQITHTNYMKKIVYCYWLLLKNDTFKRRAEVICYLGTFDLKKKKIYGELFSFVERYLQRQSSSHNLSGNIVILKYLKNAHT